MLPIENIGHVIVLCLVRRNISFEVCNAVLSMDDEQHETMKQHFYTRIQLQKWKEKKIKPEYK